MNIKFLFGLLIFASSVSTAHSEDSKGQWQRSDGEARVNIAACGHYTCVTNIWIKPGNTSEKVGQYIRLDLQSAGAGRWKGTGHDPQRNLDFSTEMVVSGDHMTTSGCVIGGIICQSKNWSRLQ